MKIVAEIHTFISRMEAVGEAPTKIVVSEKALRRIEWECDQTCLVTSSQTIVGLKIRGVAITTE